MKAEAERRLGQAKRAAPGGRPGPSPSKRHRAAAVSSDEELSDQEGSEPEDNADMGVCYHCHVLPHVASKSQHALRLHCMKTSLTWVVLTATL